MQNALLNRLNRRRAQVGLIGFIAAPLLSHAQMGWPRRPVRLVVPFPPGGIAEFLARTLATELQSAFGQPFVLEYRVGAGGTLAAAEVARSPADGHTMLMGSSSTHAIGTSLYKSLPYDPIGGFEPISLVARVPLVLVMNAEHAHANSIAAVPDLIRFALAHPGALNMASSGNGTASHIAGELFKQMTGTRVVHLPYSGTAPAMLALLAGDIDFMIDPVPTALPHIKSGRVMALAIASSQRIEALPQLPTMEEAGGKVLHGFDVTSWFGLLVPAGTPPDIVHGLERVTMAALAAPELTQRLHALGVMPVGSSAKEFARYIAEETVKWAEVVRRSGARLNE